MTSEPDEKVEFLGLPERVDPAAWVEEIPGEPIPDSTGGRDTEADSVLLNTG